MGTGEYYTKFTTNFSNVYLNVQIYFSTMVCNF